MESTIWSTEDLQIESNLFGIPFYLGYIDELTRQKYIMIQEIGNQFTGKLVTPNEKITLTPYAKGFPPTEARGPCVGTFLEN